MAGSRTPPGRRRTQPRTWTAQTVQSSSHSANPRNPIRASRVRCELWTLRSGWALRLVVGVADVDLVPLGQDLAETQAGEPGPAAQQVVQHLAPEPLAPLDRPGQVLAGILPGQAGEVGRHLLDGHVTALPLDPQVEREDEGERGQKADGAREGDPPAAAGGEERGHDRQRRHRGQEPAAGLRADGQQRDQPDDRDEALPASLRSGAHQPVEAEPQECKSYPDVDGDVGVAERVDRGAGARDVDEGERVDLGQGHRHRRPNEIPRQDAAVPAHQARNEGRLAHGGGRDQEGEDAVVPDRGVAHGVEPVAGQVGAEPEGAEAHEDQQQLEDGRAAQQVVPGRGEAKGLVDADPEDDLAHEHRGSRHVEVGEGLVEEQVAAEQQRQRRGEPAEVPWAGRRGPAPRHRRAGRAFPDGLRRQDGGPRRSLGCLRHRRIPPSGARPDRADASPGATLAMVTVGRQDGSPMRVQVDIRHARYRHLGQIVTGTPSGQPRWRSSTQAWQGGSDCRTWSQTHEP